VQEPQLKSATDDLRGRVRDTFGTAWCLPRRDPRGVKTA
jgi:hypothetical protein